MKKVEQRIKFLVHSKVNFILLSVQKPNSGRGKDRFLPFAVHRLQCCFAYETLCRFEIFVFIYYVFYSCLCVILTFHFLATGTGLNLFGEGGVGGGRGRMGLKN